VILKINFRKSRRGRQALRRWERERDPDALIELLENEIVPTQLVTALRDYLNARGGLETLLFRKRRGRSGNPAARVWKRAQTEFRYAAIRAAEQAGWRGEERFVVAAKYLLAHGDVPSKERSADGRVIHLRASDWAARLRRLYYRRYRRGPLDDFYKSFVTAFSGVMEPGPQPPKLV